MSSVEKETLGRGESFWNQPSMGYVWLINWLDGDAPFMMDGSVSHDMILPYLLYLPGNSHWLTYAAIAHPFLSNTLWIPIFHQPLLLPFTQQAQKKHILTITRFLHTPVPSWVSKDHSSSPTQLHLDCQRCCIKSAASTNSTAFKFLCLDFSLQIFLFLSILPSYAGYPYKPTTTHRRWRTNKKMSSCPRPLMDSRWGRKRLWMSIPRWVRSEATFILSSVLLFRSCDDLQLLSYLANASGSVRGLAGVKSTPPAIPRSWSGLEKTTWNDRRGSHSK